MEGIMRDINANPGPEERKCIPKKMLKKLFSYQIPHVERLVEILSTKFVALDASDTGTGKTYVTAAICKILGLQPVIICPKTIMISWDRVLESFGVQIYDTVNYETIRRCNMYSDDNYILREMSSYISNNKDRNGDPDGYFYNWDLPKNTIVVFDEAHRCKSPTSANGKLLISTKQLIQKKIPVLLLTATICEKFEDMKIPFILFRLIPSYRNYAEYVRFVCRRYPELKPDRSSYDDMSKYEIDVANSKMLIIYKVIVDYTARIKISELGDMFPENQCCAQEYFVKNHKDISEKYKKIRRLAMKYNAQQDKSIFVLPKLQKMKQEIELLKVPIFIEQTEIFLEAGFSVIIFVNFIDTLNVISGHLNTQCLIYGEQKIEDRQANIDSFQSNTSKLIICQIRAGGIGIGLHDVHGGHPRVSLINCPESATDLKQALGRAARSGAKTPVFQKIICAANVSHEKKTMDNVNRKLDNLSAINDGDIGNYTIETV